MTFEPLEDRIVLSFGTPIVNVPGQDFSNLAPPDTNGDVGPNHYVQSINASEVAIYDKAGNLVDGPFDMDSLGGPSGVGDPIVLYDHLADRWLLTEFAAPGDDRLIIHLSNNPTPTSNPTDWRTYTVQAPNFPDYPKYAVWHDAYYIGANEPDNPVYALDRAAMLGGTGGAITPVRMTLPDRPNWQRNSTFPADLDGPQAPAGRDGLYVRQVDDEITTPGTADPTQDFLEVWEFSPDFVTPGNSTITQIANIGISEFDYAICGPGNRDCIPQPGTTNGIDALPHHMMWRVQYRHFASGTITDPTPREVLVGNFTHDVGVDRAGIRWFELRDTGGGWMLFQEGDIAPPDTEHRWMAGIAMDGNSNIAIAYNVSSSTVFPGIRYTGRLATDPLGQMPQGEHVIIDGSGSQTFTNRWGDYSSMSVDPVDDTTFWFTGEYIPSNGLWTTQIAAFAFDLLPSTTGFDWGDAPDSYSTTLASNGPRHDLSTGTGLFIGVTVDDEPDGQPSFYSDEDDLTGSDDEEGVTISAIRQGRFASLAIQASAAGFVDVFLDLNRDGNYDDGAGGIDVVGGVSEEVVDNMPVMAGLNHFVYEVPEEASIGLANLRIRLNLDDDLSYDGPADDGEVNDFGVTILQKRDGRSRRSVPIGEAGSQMIDQPNAGAWTKVDLKNAYTHPVVVANIASFNGPQQATVRLRNVTSTSFEFKIDEWDYLDGRHTLERIDFVVVEKGEHTLVDGTKLAAGKTDVNHVWNTVPLDGFFTSTPVVVSQTQTFNGPQAVTQRQRNVGTGSFDVRLQEEEANDGVHAIESLGWIASEVGAMAGLTGDTITAAWSNLPVDSASILLTSMQTFDGPDPAALRTRVMGGLRQVKVEEEQSADLETIHTSEVVGFLALAPGDIELTPTPLMAADGEAAAPSSQVLTTAQVDPLIDDAVAAWLAAGISDSQADQLLGLQIGIADLSGARLAEQIGNRITLDVNAAGYGWHTGTETPAAKRMDLLTALYHELGHVLGLDDDYSDSDSVMNGWLPAGTRRIPTADDIDALFADPGSLDDALI